MEKDEIFEDDYLRELIRRSPLDTPSEDFVDRVMANIQILPETQEVKQPFYFYVKSYVPYAIITLVLVLVISTSDFSLFNWMTGSGYMKNTLLPYIGTLTSILAKAFASRYVSWVILISFSAGILFLIDRFFSRRASL